MKVFIGADHRGFDLKNQLREHLTHTGYDVEDEGALTLDPEDDFPRYAFTVTSKVLGEEGEVFGILICGSGEGMAIAANRVAGIRAALCWNTEVAAMAREHNNANVLVLPADFVAAESAPEIVDAFIEQKYPREERHQRRIEQIEEIYG